MNPNDYFFATRTLFNSTPLDDFMGLTPAEMHTLLYDPFSEKSTVQIKSSISDEVLNVIPIFRLAETLLAIIKREGYVKLTPLGLLNKKTLQELYDYKFYPDSMIENGFSKLHREVYWSIMISCRETLHIAGLIRKSKGKILLTSKAIKLLDKGMRSELYKLFLLSFIRNFNWGVNDGFTEMQMIQQNAPFAIYLLHHSGKEFRVSKYYSDWLLRAYPNIPKMLRILDGEENIEYFHRCFNTRFFERFTQWFGITERQGEPFGLKSEKSPFRTTAIFDDIFQFD